MLKEEDYQFRVDPFPYQRREWSEHKETLARATFWEQGLGKSKLTIDQACWMHLRGLIDAVVVVAPNGVHRNWVEEEIPAHVPLDLLPRVRALFYQSDKAGTRWHQRAVEQVTNHSGFAWLTVAYESWTTPTCKKALIDFFDRRKVCLVLDESHYIKNPAADRTKSILKCAKYAKACRVLTGTPIAVGPFDIYTQIQFLYPNFWRQNGFSTVVEFRNHFGVFTKIWNPTAYNPVTKARTGNEVKVLAGYRRLGQLQDLLRPLSSRLTKEEAGLKLPPKKYSLVPVEMSAEQAELYGQMKTDYQAWIRSPELLSEKTPEVQKPLFSCPSCGDTKEVISDGYIYPCPECAINLAVDERVDGDRLVVANLAMVRLLRLQQIACGYLPTDEEEDPIYVIPGENPRLNLCCEIIEQKIKHHKVIVWARFRLDIDLILGELKKRGILAVRYDGAVGEDERAEAKALFKGERPVFENGVLVGRQPIPEEAQAQVFVGNPSAGATGLTLNVAKTTIYYSNGFKLIDRLQSEDRNHRIGQTSEVEYIDLVATGTVDEKIVESHRRKLSIASQILGDKFKEWI